MHALDILGDPVRRRIVELLADGELAAGDVGRVVQQEFGISQPAVSQHLRVLRESGFATVRAEGTRRLYALDPAPIHAAAEWFTPFERFWRPKLDALGTELARSRRQRRLAAASAASAEPADAEPADAVEAGPDEPQPDGSDADEASDAPSLDEPSPDAPSPDEDPSPDESATKET